MGLTQRKRYVNVETGHGPDRPVLWRFGEETPFIDQPLSGAGVSPASFFYGFGWKTGRRTGPSPVPHPWQWLVLAVLIAAAFKNDHPASAIQLDHPVAIVSVQFQPFDPAVPACAVIT